MKFKESETVDLLYVAGYIEHWGTDIKNMKKWMQNYELPAPKYREDGLCFVVVLKRKEGTKRPAGAPQVPRK